MVELNATHYRQPSETTVLAWLDTTPPDFRFAVKAQRGGTLRALTGDPVASVAWLTRPYRWFGERLGAVLVRIPDQLRPDLARLRAFLAAWPAELPLTVEARRPEWAVDEVFEALAAAGAVLCATELPDAPEPPTIRRTGPFLYLRLRRETYSAAELAIWAERLVPFLDDGLDAFAVFRHDEIGLAPEWALGLEREVGARRA